MPLDDGRLLPLNSERLRPLLAALFELFELGAITEVGELRLNPMQAADLADLAAATAAIDLRWLGGERLLELGTRLRNAEKSSRWRRHPASRASFASIKRRG